MQFRRSLLVLAALAPATTLFSAGALAQTFPAKPITIVIGSTPGSATDGLEAVAAARHEVDVVVMDVRMPGLDGLEATKQIRALDDPALAGITILAMTANACDEDRQKALKCGMDGFLSKPIVIEELNSIMQKNLD